MGEAYARAQLFQLMLSSLNIKLGHLSKATLSINDLQRHSMFFFWSHDNSDFELTWGEISLATNNLSTREDSPDKGFFY